jgi:2TM domain
LGEALFAFASYTTIASRKNDELNESSMITKEATMYSQTNYVQAALQIQRWRDFGSQVFAYVIGNIVFIVVWAAQGRGFFWPIYPLLVWGLGLSVQHFSVVIRGQITDEDVRRKLNRNGGDMQAS